MLILVTSPPTNQILQLGSHDSATARGLFVYYQLVNELSVILGSSVSYRNCIVSMAAMTTELE